MAAEKDVSFNKISIFECFAWGCMRNFTERVAEVKYKPYVIQNKAQIDTNLLFCDVGMIL